MVAAVCMITSCGEKDGVFNPKEKISAIYYSATYQNETLDRESGEWVTSTDSIPKSIGEKWNWEGKKVTSIEQYEYDGETGSSNMEAKIRFEYDGKRLGKMYIQMTGSEEVEYNFVYNDNRLEKMQFGYMGQYIDVYGFEFEGDKLSNMIMYAGAFEKRTMKSEQRQALNYVSDLLMRTYIPGYEMTPRIKRAIDDAARSNGRKDGEVENITIKYEWEGENITSLSVNGYTMRFKYDDKKSPIKGFLPLINMYSELQPAEGATYGAFVFSKNNITEVSYDEEKFTFSYTYDGNWPTTRTSVEEYEYPGEHFTYTSVIYYEYK